MNPCRYNSFRHQTRFIGLDGGPFFPGIIPHHSKRTDPLWESVLLVRMAGLEPARPVEHQHLKLASLPIPAHPQLA